MCCPLKSSYLRCDMYSGGSISEFSKELVTVARHDEDDPTWRKWASFKFALVWRV